MHEGQSRCVVKLDFGFEVFCLACWDTGCVLHGGRMLAAMRSLDSHDERCIWLLPTEHHAPNMESVNHNFMRIVHEYLPTCPSAERVVVQSCTKQCGSTALVAAHLPAPHLQQCMP